MPFDADTELEAGPDELVIVPIHRGVGEVDFHLAHRTDVPTSEPYGMWRTWVDAHSGEILFRDNRVEFAYEGTTETSRSIFVQYGGMEKYISAIEGAGMGFEASADVAAGQALIEAAGYAKGDDGIYEKDGADLVANITVNTASTELTRAVDVIIVGKHIGVDRRVLASCGDIVHGDRGIVHVVDCQPDVRVIASSVVVAYLVDVDIRTEEVGKVRSVGPTRSRPVKLQ